MKFDEDFPVLKEFTYLNTAYSGLLAKPVAVWRCHQDEEFLNGGSNFRVKNASVIHELRENLGSFFHTQKEKIYLVSNFSFGFNTLINGLAKSNRFLLLRNDYPTINHAVKSCGFAHREVELDEDFESRVIEAIENFRPSIFVFSLVQYITGYRIDMGFIRKVKENYPDLLLIADGTQFCGTAKLDFEASGLDALLGSGYKWLLGGYGNGYAILSDQMKSVIYTERSKIKATDENVLNGRDYLSLCFEPGHLDALNFGSLNQGIKYLENVGIEFIEKQTQELTQKAREEFYARGLLSRKDLDRTTQSTIINLSVSRLFETITTNRILCAQRGDGLRFAFHFYNTTADLTNLLNVIDKHI